MIYLTQEEHAEMKRYIEARDSEVPLDAIFTRMRHDQRAEEWLRSFRDRYVLRGYSHGQLANNQRSSAMYGSQYGAVNQMVGMGTVGSGIGRIL